MNNGAVTLRAFLVACPHCLVRPAAACRGGRFHVRRVALAKKSFEQGDDLPKEYWAPDVD